MVAHNKLTPAARASRKPPPSPLAFLAGLVALCSAFAAAFALLAALAGTFAALAVAAYRFWMGAN